MIICYRMHGLKNMWAKSSSFIIDISILNTAIYIGSDSLVNFLIYYDNLMLILGHLNEKGEEINQWVSFVLVRNI